MGEQNFSEKECPSLSFVIDLLENQKKEIERLSKENGILLATVSGLTNTMASYVENLKDKDSLIDTFMVLLLRMKEIEEDDEHFKDLLVINGVDLGEFKLTKIQ